MDSTPLIEAQPLGLLGDDEGQRLESALRDDPELKRESEALAGAYACLSAQVAAELEEPWSADLKERALAACLGQAPRVSVRPKVAEHSASLPPPAAGGLQIRVHLTCIYCHAETSREEVLFCASCLAPHHEECFATHGRCSAPGCEETHGVRPTEPVAPPAPVPPRRRLALPWAASLVLVGIGTAALVEFGPSLAPHAHESLETADTTSAELLGAVKEASEACDERLRAGWVALDSHDGPGALGAANAGLAALDPVVEGLALLDLRPGKGPDTKRLRQAQTRVKGRRVRCLILRARAAMLDGSVDALAATEADLETILAPQEGLNPRSADALIVRGEFLVVMGALDDAARQFELARGLMPNSARACCGQAQVHLLQEDPASALFALADALRALDDKPQRESEVGADWVQVEVLSGLQRARLREQILVRRAEARLLHGGLGPPGGAFRDAKNAFEAAAGKSWRASAIQGAIFAKQGRLFQAVDLFEEAIRISESAAPRVQAEAHCALAEGYLTCGLPFAAGRVAAKASELDAENLLATVLRAEAEEQLLNAHEARELALLAIKGADKRHWKTHARALRLLARIEGAQGNVPDAREFAKQAILLDEKGFASRVLLSRLELDPYFDGQYLDSAERYLRAADRQRNNSVATARGRGFLDLQKFANDPARAKRHLFRAKQLDPSDPWTLSLLARAYAELALREPEQRGTPERRAAREWDRSLRFERDVRLPAGKAYAKALRHHKLALRPEDPDRTRETHFAEARKAYRQAVWLCPTHSQARAGLGSIALYQRAKERVHKHLQAGFVNNPNSIQIAVLNARSLALLSDAPAGLRQAEVAVEEALNVRGETAELLQERLFVEFSRATLPRDQDAADALVEEIYTAYDRLLEAKFPSYTATSQRKIDLLGRLSERARRLGPDLLPVMRAFHQAQQSCQRDLESRLEREAKAVEAESDKVDQALAAGDHGAALQAAHRLVLSSPFRAESWVVYAQAHGRLANPWQALEAGLHAAWLDERHLELVFPLLREADSTHHEPGSEPETLHPDLQVLLQAAPFVARSLGSKAGEFKARSEFAVEARKVFADLERVVARDPTRLLAHTLIGALSFAVERDDYAVQNLLFVAEAQSEFGEAAYLAAVASARNESGRRGRNDVLAVRSLQAATRVGFSWEARARVEPAFNRLRRDPALWNSIARDLEGPR